MPRPRKKPQNTPETKPPHDEIDKAICNIVRVHPEATDSEVTRKLNNTGIVISHQAVYHRLKKRDYLRRDIEEIRQNHREQISRELMPLALKATKKALKDKSLSLKDKHQYVNTVIKSDLGDQGANDKPATINIEQLENLQIIMGKIGDTSQ